MRATANSSRARAAPEPCAESTWPDLDASPKNNNGVCGTCKVLVDNFDTKYKTCRRYCEAIGRSCVGQWEEYEDECTVKAVRDCDYEEPNSDAICECSGIQLAAGGHLNDATGSLASLAPQTGHNYIGRNYIGHAYIGHNYIGHTYVGHDYLCTP